MTQRLWIVAFTCGVSAVFAPGCTGLRGQKDEMFRFTGKDKPPPDMPGEEQPDVIAAEEQRREQTGQAAEKIQRVGHASADGLPRIQIAPADPTAPGPVARETLGSMFPRAEEAAKAPPDPAVVSALRSFMAKDLPKAVSALQKYDEGTQKALLLLLPWVAQFAQGSFNQAGPKDIALFLDQLEDLDRRLRPRATLSLGKVCFCQGVRGFGMIDPLPGSPRFLAGGGGRFGEGMILYVEVGNTASRPVGQHFETRIAGALEILDGQKRRAWSKVFPAEANVSVSPRHDYFIIFRLPVPPNLPPGRYSLVIQLTDQTWSGSSKETPPYRMAGTTLDFEVVSADAARGPVRTTTLVVPAAGGHP